MSGKKQSDWTEAVRDAATGYAAVVLGIACFLLALAVVMAGVRAVVGTGSASATAGTTTATATAASPTATGTAANGTA